MSKTGSMANLILRKHILNLNKGKYIFNQVRRTQGVRYGLRVKSLITARVLLQKMLTKGYPSSGTAGS